VYAQALHKLVSSSYLKPSTALSHISPRDKRISYETEEKAKITSFPTAKELRLAREVAAGRLKREEEEAEQVGTVSQLPPRSDGHGRIECGELQKPKNQVSSRPSKACKAFLPIDDCSCSTSELRFRMTMSSM
jgi:hypothetical protein